jgi:transposase
VILWPKPLYLLGCSGVIKPIKTSTSALPTDTHALQQMVLQMQAELSDNHKKLSAQDSVIDNLRHQLAVLKRARFGRSSEQVEHNIHQLELQLEELEIAQAQTTPSSSAASTAKKTPRRRITLPEHLAREEYRLDTHECCPDCQGALCHIGDDVSEILDVVPASYRVIKTVRPKYSCKACDSVVQASAPQRVINKGLPSAALLTQVMVDKYMDHQPLYRQAQQMAREEIDVERSTLADWVGQVSHLLTPLADAIGRHVKAASHLHADDTTAPTLSPGKGRTQTGRYWTYVRDGRAWNEAAPTTTAALKPDHEKLPDVAALPR